MNAELIYFWKKESPHEYDGYTVAAGAVTYDDDGSEILPDNSTRDRPPEPAYGWTRDIKGKKWISNTEAPEPTPEQHKEEILKRLEVLDQHSIRPMCSILCGTAVDEDITTLQAIEAEKIALREELAGLTGNDIVDRDFIESLTHSLPENLVKFMMTNVKDRS
jgi:hypothetical protein